MSILEISALLIYAIPYVLGEAFEKTKRKATCRLACSSAKRKSPPLQRNP